MHSPSTLALQTTYLVLKLPDQAVPLARLGVDHAVHSPARHLDDIVEAGHAGHVLQHVHAEPAKPIVPRQVLLFFKHHEGRLLQVSEGRGQGEAGKGGGGGGSEGLVHW